MNEVTKKQLCGLVEASLIEKLDEDLFETVKMDAVDLLTWNRLDLAYKLFYLDIAKENKELAEKVYREDIRAEILDEFIEFGNNNISTFDSYLEAFEKIYSDFKSTKLLIPISADNTILNGAHRTAVAIHQNKCIDCVKLKIPIHKYDYIFYRKMSVPPDIIALAVTKFIEYAKNTYIAFLWPSGREAKEEVHSKFSKVVYKYEIKLNATGAFNLLYELYHDTEWIGNRKNDFKGLQEKMVECFPIFDKFTILVFQSESIEKVRKLKDEIRLICNIGFSSTHMTDTREEAIRISQLVFNENGRHFLNYGNPHKYKSSQEKIQLMQDFIFKNQLAIKNLVLDTGMTLSLYGIRESNNIDYLVKGTPNIIQEIPSIEAHDEQLKYHKEKKLDLIYNPEFYFSYKNMKFIAFKQVSKMKINRREKKDRNDSSMMKNLIEDNIIHFKLTGLKQKLLYMKTKTKMNTITLLVGILKKIKLYSISKSIYHKIKK